MGGAIFFSCSEYYGTDQSKCSLALNNVNFTQNRAEIQGGAVKWTFFEPTLSKSVNFNGNTAGIYGDNIASMAKSLVKIYKNQTSYKTLSKIRVLEDSSPMNVNDIQSGGKFSLYFALIDKYGTVIQYDNNSKLLIRSVQEGES